MRATKAAIGLLLLLMLGLHGASSAAAVPVPVRSAQAALAFSSTMEDRVITLTNRKRAAHGCGPLRLNRDLRQAARRHTKLMAEARAMDHQLPGEPTLGTRVTRAGYTGWVRLAENLARGQATPADVVRAWMASPGHRRNILDCGLRHIGVGYVKYGSTSWWTQDFGRR